jgi:hypothetical protein
MRALPEPRIDETRRWANPHGSAPQKVAERQDLTGVYFDPLAVTDDLRGMPGISSPQLFEPT